MVERGLLELGHHLGVIVVARIGGREDLDERLGFEREAETAEGAGLLGRRFHQDVVVADLDDAGARGGDGGTSLDVEDVRNAIERNAVARALGGGRCDRG
jgi:hypothetical protein